MHHIEPEHTITLGNLEAIKRSGRGYVGLPPGEIAELIGDLLAMLHRWETSAVAKADLLEDAASSAEAALVDLRRRVIRDRGSDLARLEDAVRATLTTADELRRLANPGEPARDRTVY